MADDESGLPAHGRASIFALHVNMKWDNSVSLKQFLEDSKADLGKRELAGPLSKLERHWVETVGDLRLLIQEGMLRSLGLPLRLAIWMERELAQARGGNATIAPSFVEVKQGGGPLGFTYQFDFDTNGILYHIGTRGGTTDWSNPSTSGLVRVTASGLLHDSVPMDAVVGRETVRCVTSSSQNSWFCVDLIDKWATITHYTLRHYSSWDTECVRYWCLEGSLDGENFVIMSKHDNDTSLNGQGATHTWKVDSLGQAYRMFRVRMTGPNSNNHMYLALSGVEFYGQLTSTPPKGAMVVATPQNMPNAGGRTFFPRGTFTGVINYLGTMHGGSFENPMTRGLVHVSASSLVNDSEPASAIVDRKVVRCVTKAEKNSWFMIDFTPRSVAPTYYMLRHYASWDTEALRHWVFQGSNDGVTWTDLMAHSDDRSLALIGATHTWQLPANVHNRSFRVFRVLQTGPNSNNHHYLALSGFELYGRLYEGQADPSPVAQVQQQPQIRNVAAEPKMASSLVFHGTREHVHQADFDDNGIIHFIATQGLKKPWLNPSKMGWVNCVASSLMQDSTSVDYIVGQEVVRCVTKPHENSWFLIDLIDKYVVPTAYTIRHYASWDVEALRNWNLEGSNDGASWTLLKRHTKDSSLAARGATHTWKLPKSQTPYRMFRILQWGPNSNNHHYLAVSGFELYGTLMSELGDDFAVADNIKNALVWSRDIKGAKIELSDDGLAATNTGSNDKWQMVRTVHSVHSGVYRYSLLIETDAKTSNTWKFIVGVIPTAFPPAGKEWVGAYSSWGYIGGTGGKCHKVAKTYDYGRPFGEGDVVHIDLDFNSRTIAFSVNNDPMGVAWDNLSGPVHLAVSFTGTNSRVRIIDSKDAKIPRIPAAARAVGGGGWDPKHCKKFLQVDATGKLVTNMGSNNKWQSVRTEKSYSAGKQEFTIRVHRNKPTPNNWRFIVGVVPPNFPLSWVGAAGSWGYIAGTGGKCHNVGSSVPYGKKWGEVGDEICVKMDFDEKTIEFFRNGESQGIAFTDLKGPVFGAVSLTATDATIALAD